MDNLNANRNDTASPSCRKNGEITITNDMEELKERETYSFAIANNNKEISMNKHIQEVLGKGRTISSYMKSLIKSDMEGDVSHKESINLDSLTKKIDTIETLVKNNQSSDISFKNDDKVLEKLIGLEIIVNQINLNSSKDSVILDRLTTLDTLIRNISVPSSNNVPENMNSSVYNELIAINDSIKDINTKEHFDKMNSLVDLVKSLANKIDEQDNLIKNLNTTINAQSQIISNLNLINNQKLSNDDENIDSDIDDDISTKQEEARRKSKKILKADF
ncbi:hypothetical protein QTH61_14500 [Clostridium perfringens]|nr:hypothetical protein [Clostridium perfringens]